MSECLSKSKSDDLNPSTDENKSPRIQSNPSSVHPCQQSSSHLEAQETTCTGVPPTEAQVTSSPHEDTPVNHSNTTSTGTVAASGVITTTTSTLAGDVITTAASTGTEDVVNVSTAAAAAGTTATAATKAVSDSSSNPKVTPTSSLIITNANTTKTTTTSTTSTTPIATGVAKLQKAGPSQKQRRGGRKAVTGPSSSSASAMVVNVPCDPPGELSHPSTAGGNGHVLPQGTGENRDAPHNPSPLPTSSSGSTISHGERQIGVPPPAPRKADAQRNSECIASFNQRLTKESVKRRLFEVDHAKVENDVSKELNKIVESDKKRLRENYELLPPEVNSNAPAFYHTTEITSNRKRVAVSSSTTTTISSSSSSVGALVTSSLTANTRDVALASSSSAKSENGAHGGSSSSGTSAEVTGVEIDSGAGARGRPSSLAPPEEVRAIRSTDESPLPLSSPARRTSQRLLATRRNPNIPERSPSSSSSSSSSPFTSPSSSSSLFSSPISSSLSSSLNLSTSSRSSSSGVSSLESTPTQERQSSQQSVTPAGTNTPVGSVDAPTQRGGTPPMVGRTTPTQETSASIQRPSTATNVRKKRPTQSPPPDSSRRRKLPRI